jgi:hypothetical protein
MATDPSSEWHGAELGYSAFGPGNGVLPVLYRVTLFERIARVTLYRLLPEGPRGLPSRPREPIADHAELLSAADQFLDKFLIPITDDESKADRHDK